jgi:hypothetical protein
VETPGKRFTISQRSKNGDYTYFYKLSVFSPMAGAKAKVHMAVVMGEEGERTASMCLESCE